MLMISENEMNMFSKIQENNLTKELIEHIRVEFPEEVKNLLNENVNQIVAYAQEKSKQYGFTEKSDIFQYVNLMMIFGPYFDVKEAWAKKILTRPLKQSGAAKMLNLYHEAENY